MQARDNNRRAAGCIPAKLPFADAEAGLQIIREREDGYPDIRDGADLSRPGV